MTVCQHRGCSAAPAEPEMQVNGTLFVLKLCWPEYMVN